MQYTTKEGEKLDIICLKKYGYVNNSFEKVLYDPVNYDLTTNEIFTAGVVFELPIIKPDEKRTENALWD